MSAVWGLDTGRIGEFMQVKALGTALDLPFEHIPLSSKGVLSSALPAAPPCLIISFGRAAPFALKLAAQFSTRPLLVHLGTIGHAPSKAFDLIITMPQDDYPMAENVYSLKLPLNGASLSTSAKPQKAGGACTTFIGGVSRYFQITPKSIEKCIEFSLTLAKANAEPLHVITSPRTPVKAFKTLRQLQKTLDFSLSAFGQQPFQNSLEAGSRFVITQDSASLIADTYRTGKPVWVFPLPGRFDLSKFLQDTTDYCFGSELRHWFVRRGWLGGGINFHRWHKQASEEGYIHMATGGLEQTLSWAPACSLPDTDLSQCRELILRKLHHSPLPQPKRTEFAREIPEAIS